MATRRRTPRRAAGARKSRGARRWVLILVAFAAVFAAGLYLGGGRLGRDDARPAAGPSREPGSGDERSPAAARPPQEQPLREPYADLDEPRAAPAARQEVAPEAASDGTASELAAPYRPAESVGDVVAGGDGPVGHLALVIDDLGRSLADLDALQALGVPVTHAVLPFESMTRQVVATLRKREVEMILHLPMEAAGGANPGPGALTSAMSAAELRQTTLAALAAVPGAAGVNNHMGSELSADPRAMRTVLQVLTERELFFLDSRTSPASAGYQVARELGLPAAERQVFLDADPAIEAVRTEWQRWLELARTRGAAIAIGHPHPGTLAVLAEEVPRARAAGFEFVPVSFLLERDGGTE